MSAAALALLLALPSQAAPVDAFIDRVSALVAQEQGKDARDVRDLDRRIEALSSQAAALGYQAAVPLGHAAADPAKPLKLRLWLVASLESLRDPAAFGPLSDLALDPAAPDLLREAALRAVAASPVSARARRQALCAALDAQPGAAALAQALFELRSLGCNDVAALERLAAPGAPHADWAIAALAVTRGPAGLDALDGVFRREKRGSPERLAVLEALRARAAELTPHRERWASRAAEMAEEEARAPANAAAALRLIAAVGDPSAAPAVARLLGNPDGSVVVAAAETLAALRNGRSAPEIRAIYAGYLQDPRFASGPGRDPVGWYDRLGAALKALNAAP